MRNALEWFFIFLGDIVAATVGSKIAHHGGQERDGDKGGSTPTEAAAKILREMLEKMKFDRGEFLHELSIINAKTHGGIKAIIDLFNKFGRRRGLLTVGKRIYRENWVGKMLMEINPEHRTEEYRRLSEVLSESRKDFFANLEILNDDKIQQIVRQTMSQANKFARKHGISGKLEKADQSVASLLDSILR